MVRYPIRLPSWLINDPIPQIASISPPILKAGSNTTDLSIFGSGFSKASAVLWNGQSRPVTFLSASALRISASALDLAAGGSVAVTVSNPAPGGGDSNLSYFLISQNMAVNDAAWDAASNRLLLSISGSSATNPNTVAAYLPDLGFALQYFPVGAEPGKLAISDDGSKLFVALNGEGALGRYSLPGVTLDAKYPNGTVPIYTFGTLQIEDLRVVPGQNTVAAASLMNRGVSPRHAGVAVYDSNGRRPTTTPGHTGSNALGFGSDPDVLHGLNNETTEFGFRRMKINASGVVVDKVLTDSFSSNFQSFGGFGGNFRIIHDKVFTQNGAVLDKDTLEVIAKLNAAGSIAYNVSSDTVYFVSGNSIAGFNASSLQFLGQAQINLSNSFTPSALAFGDAGLVMASSQDFFILNPVVLSPLQAAAGSLIVANGANFRPTPVAPGMLTRLLSTVPGLALGPDESIAAPPGAQPFPISLGGVQVTFDGIPAPLISVKKNEIFLAVPYEVWGRSQSQLQVLVDGSPVSLMNVAVVESAPGLFTVDGRGLGQAIVSNEDGNANSADNPATRGSVISLFATGAGQTDPPGVDGRVSMDMLAKPLLPVSVRIGGLDATVLNAASAPGQISGLVKVDVRVPENISSAAFSPVLLQIGTTAAPVGATIAVK